MLNLLRVFLPHLRDQKKSTMLDKKTLDFDPAQSEISFRPMTRADLAAVIAIEQSVYNFPWSANTFGDCLRVGYSCWVGELREEVMSYGIISVAAGESHVMNVCVAPGVQGYGFGRRMMQKLIDEAVALNAESMFLEVRPSNEAALTLYQNMGFNEIGVRKNYYQALDGREDALMLARVLVFEMGEA